MRRCPLCHQEYGDDVSTCPNDGQSLPVAIDPMLGQVLDNKYRLEKCIGLGGMATVYLATRLQIGDEVAVKVLNADSLKNPLAVARFRREAQAAARIRHNAVVTIHDMGNLPEGNTFLVMEYIKGRCLRDELKEHTTLTVPRALTIISAVCNAVHAAHEAGIIHRDLKPENIMIEKYKDGTETIKVVDFGVAELQETVISDGLTKLTEAGMMVGTPYYISPEQCRGDELDARADIYSLGIILYELLTGKVPFRGRTLSAVIIQHATEPPPPLRKTRLDVSEIVESVVLRALAKDRKNRPTTALELAQELERALAGTTLSEGADIIRPANNTLIHNIEPGRTKFSIPPRSGAYSAPRKTGALSYDSLTGLHSQAYFMRLLEENIVRCAQFSNHLSVVIIGIDKFKRINDGYGYLMGDLLLREVGYLINKQLPEQGALCRAPGDTFGLMLLGLKLDRVMDWTDNLIKLITKTAFLEKEIPGGIHVTICAGVATYPEDSLSSLELFERATQSMAIAKIRGISQSFHGRMTNSEAASQKEPKISFEGFVGRKTELEKLYKEFEQSLAGRGRLTIIVGDAGLGKTKLVEEFRRKLTDKDVLFLQAHFYESGGAIPYKVLCNSLRDSIHYLLEYNKEEAEIAFGSISDRVIADFTTADPLALFFSGEINYSSGAEQEKYRFFDYLARIYASLASLRPIILFLDDLQWADEVTLDFLAYMMRTNAGSRIFILATSREWEISTDNNLVRGWLRQMSRYGNQEQIKLAPLSTDEIGLVLKLMFGRIEISAGMLTRLCQETKGNPFYLIEIVRLLLEEKHIGWNGSAWHCQDVGEIRLPNSVVDLVESHLAKLPAEALELFTYAAVLGDEFTFDTLQTVTGMDEDHLLPIIESGLRERILKEEPSSREDRYSFYHSTVRKVLYERTSRRRRKRLHQQIGHKLEGLYGDRVNKIASELAYHYYNAEDYEHSLSYAVEAGNLAWRTLSFSEAAKYYEWAEKSIESITASIKEEGRIGTQIFQLAACGLQIEANRMAQYHLNYGQLLMLTGKHKRAEAELRQTLEFARQVRSLRLIGQAFTALGELYRQYGQLHRGLEYGEQGLAIHTSIEDMEWEIQALMVVAASREGLGQFIPAIENYEGALILARKAKDKVSEGNALWGIGFVYYRLGQYEKALESAKRGLEITAISGDKLGQERGYSLIGVILLEIGQYQEAIKQFERALKIARDLGYRLREISVLNNIGENHRYQGLYLEAISYYQQALAISIETAERTMHGTILHNIGLVYQGQGDHEEAIKEILSAQKIVQEVGARFVEMEILISLGDSFRALNRLLSARTSYQHALDLSRQSGSLVVEWRAFYGLARCSFIEGDKPQALKMLRKSVDVIEMMSSELSAYANRVSFLKNKQIVYNDLAELSQELYPEEHP